MTSKTHTKKLLPTNLKPKSKRQNQDQPMKSNVDIK